MDAAAPPEASCCLNQCFQRCITGGAQVLIALGLLLVAGVAAPEGQGAGTSAGLDGRTTVLVLPIVAQGAAERDLAEQLTAYLTAKSGAGERYKLQSLREVEGALTQEQTRQVAGCDQLGCAAEIAGALNTDEIVLGTLGRVGSEYVLTLTRIRARDASVLGRVAERFSERNRSAMLDNMPAASAQLFGLPPPAQPSASENGATADTAGAPTAGGNRLFAWGVRGVSAAVMAVGAMGLLLSLVAAGVGGGILVYEFANREGTRHAITQTMAVGSQGALVVAGLGIPLGLVVLAAGAAALAVAMVLL